jgi:predicted house-cleaning noncanonical NTP pyrophosphatase (MazG superfamily)
MSAAAAGALTLVRDRGPELSGAPWLGEVVALDQYPAALQATLTGKATAYLTTGDPADLVDALEALDALGEANDLDRAQLEAYRHGKALRRGRSRRRLARPRRSGA